MVENSELISCDLVHNLQLRPDLLQVRNSITDRYDALYILVVYKEIPELLYEIRHELFHDILKGNRIGTIFCKIIPDSHCSYRKILCLYEILLVKYGYLETSRTDIEQGSVLGLLLSKSVLCSAGLVIHKPLFRIAEHRNVDACVLFYPLKNHD